MGLITISAIVLLFVLNHKQSKRITDLEQIVKNFKSPQAKHPAPPQKPPPNPSSEQSQSFLTRHPQNKKEEKKSITPETQKLQQSEPKIAEPTTSQWIQPTKKILLPLVAIIKDNWIGVVGALAIVIGAVFFSLTAEIMQNPLARIGSLLVFSLALVITSFKLKKSQQWTLLSSWLTSIAGATTLFASFGAGAIEGLQCIPNPINALIFLCLGISFNLFLALRSPSQFIASFHVLLSLTTLCMVSQTEQLILIGAIVSAAGLAACFRHKWELHLSLIIIMFSVQNILCYQEIGSASPYLPIISSLLVGCSAAMVHYKKAYRHPSFDPLPFCIHLLNWGLLGWNVFLYAEYSNWTPIALGSMSIAGFILARIAKRKEIVWLFRIDTILAQLVAIGALVSLTRFPIKPIDITLLISLESLLFISISNLYKEKVFVRYGYLLQWIINLSTILLLDRNLEHDFFFYLRIGAITLMNWGYYFIAHLKHFSKDAFICFTSSLPLKNQNAKSTGNSTPSFHRFHFVISPILLTGSISLCIGAYYSAQSILIPPLIMLFVLGLGLWKKNRPHHSPLDCTLLLSLIALHLIYWNTLVAMPSPSMGNLAWIGVLDAALVFGLFLHSRTFRNLLYCIAIYGLAIHWVLVTYYFTKNTTPLVPAVLYLGYSLIALELSKIKYLKAISHLFFQAGFVCVLCSVTNFILVHFQIQPVWKGLYIRWIIEFLTLSTLGYWFFFPTKNLSTSKISTHLHKSLIELFIGFLTLCIFADCAEYWRALSWALIAYIFLKIAKKPHFPNRIYLYSWAYFLGSIVHTAFLTHYQTPKPHFILEKAYLPAFISILIQIAYSIACFKERKKAKTASRLHQRIFQSPSLSTLLPIFLGMGLILFFNFEKAILTLLWVGLICLYIMISLVVKSKKAVQICLATLAICSLRLIVFDLTQHSLSTRALVFIGVGSIMLVISVLYNKFKYRLELNENI